MKSAGIRCLVAALLGPLGCGHTRPAREAPGARPATSTPSGPAAEPPASEWIGSAACGECHEKKYARWKQSGHAAILARADGPSAVPRDSPLPEGVSLEGVAYVVAGPHVKRFVGRDEEGLFLFHVQYWMGERRFAPWRPERTPERDRYDYWELCAGCHTTGSDPERRELGELGVGCEACHGPGGRHARDPEGVEPVEIDDLPKDRALMVCGRCHTAGSDPSGRFAYPVGHRPGDDLDASFRHEEPTIGDPLRSWPRLATASFWPDGSTAKYREQYVDLRRSEHAREGILCTTCHWAHGPREGGEEAALRAPLAELCGDCHEDELDHARHGHHEPDEADCADCHMPKLGFMGEPNASSDHTFRVPDPSESERQRTPSACIVCHEHRNRDNAWAAGVLRRARARSGRGH